MIIKVTDGDHFDVWVCDDYVIKKPKEPHVKDVAVLNRIADIQTELSGKVKGVLPCKRIGMALIMPKAPGLRGDEVDEVTWETKVKPLRDEIVAEIKQLGYTLPDWGNARNIFYDGEAGQVYIVDFHSAFKNRLKEG